MQLFLKRTHHLRAPLSNAHATARVFEITRVSFRAPVARALHALQRGRTTGYQKFCDGAVHDKRVCV
jgi:hypothetical protein